MGQLADAVDREAAWLADEPLPGYPPVLNTGDNDGPFDVVEARPRRLSQHPRQLFVCRSDIRETRDGNAKKLITHSFVLAILWPFNSPESAHVDWAALDAAVEAVVLRVRGNIGDHTHGGRFLSVADQGGLDSQSGGSIDVKYPEWRGALDPTDSPLAARNALIVEVGYNAVESVNA